MAERTRSAAAVSWPALALIAVAAIIARLALLGREGLWCDEGYTAWIVHRSIPEMLRALQRLDDAPPLFYLLTSGTTAVLGRSEFALRLLPALAGIAAVVWLLARARRGRDASSLWAAAFLAVAAYGVFHARQARGYGLVMLFALAVVLGARDLLLRPTRRAGQLVAIAGILLVLTHNLGILICLTGALLWPLRARPGLPLRRWAMWHAPPLIVWVIYALLSTSQLRVHAELNAWMGEFWRSHPLILAPLLSIAAFAPGTLPRLADAVPFPALANDSTPLIAVSGIAAGLLLAAAFLPGLRLGKHRLAVTEPGIPEGRRAATIDAAFCLAPLGAMVLASFLWTPTYVLSRTDAIAFVPFALWLGRGLSRVPRGAAVAAIVFWSLVSLSALGPTYGLGAPGRAKGADREVARAIVHQGLRPSDWVVQSYLTAPTLEYYLERAGAAHRTEFYPRDASTNPAAVRPASPDSLEAYVREARELRGRLDRELSSDGAVWVPAVIDPQHAAAGASLTAGDLAYPTGVLIYHLVGNQPLTPVARYRQDWVGGDRALLRLPRRSWVPLESLGPVRFAETPATGTR